MLFLCFELSLCTRVRNRRVLAVIEPFMHRGVFHGLVAFATSRIQGIVCDHSTIQAVETH